EREAIAAILRTKVRRIEVVAHPVRDALQWVERRVVLVAVDDDVIDRIAVVRLAELDIVAVLRGPAERGDGDRDRPRPGRRVHRCGGAENRDSRRQAVHDAVLVDARERGRVAGPGERRRYRVAERVDQGREQLALKTDWAGRVGGIARAKGVRDRSDPAARRAVALERATNWRSG